MKIYRHNKTKEVYQILHECKIEESNTLAVAYMNLVDEVIWVRPKAEFFDGRFSKIKVKDLI